MSLGNGNTSSIREGRHPMGVTVLDEEKLKGLPKGSTIAILGDGDSASELLMHSLASTGRRTEYILTQRSEYGLMDDIIRARSDDVEESQIRDNVVVRDTVKNTDSIDEIVNKSLNVVDNGNLIIDTFSSYHNKPKEMQQMARNIHMKTKKNNGLTYLYFVANKTSDLTREEQEILQMVDGVFNVKTDIVGTDSIENNLFINKMRGMKLPDNAQNLVFGEKLTVDVTSDIG